jgi:hypothetical protein
MIFMLQRAKDGKFKRTDSFIHCTVPVHQSDVTSEPQACLMNTLLIRRAENCTQCYGELTKTRLLQCEI